MKLIFVLSIIFFLNRCQSSKEKTQIRIAQPLTRKDSLETKPYKALKKEIEESRKQFSIKYAQLNTASKKELLDEIKEYWVKNNQY